MICRIPTWNLPLTTPRSELGSLGGHIFVNDELNATDIFLIMFLRTCFKAAMEQPEGTTVILGGDMNLRVSAYF